MSTDAGGCCWWPCPSCDGNHGYLPYTTRLEEQDDAAWHAGHPMRVVIEATCPTTGETLVTSNCLGPGLLCAVCDAFMSAPLIKATKRCPECGAAVGGWQ